MTAAMSNDSGSTVPQTDAGDPQITSIHPSRTDACGFRAVGSSADILPLACEQAYASSMALDAENVYWITQGGIGIAKALGNVMKIPKAGGSAITLAAQRSPVGLAVDSTSVYWTELSGAVMVVPKQGGTPRTLASTTGNPQEVAVDSKRLYWCDLDGALFTLPMGGGTPVSLAECGGSDVAVGKSTIYWTKGSDCGSTIMSMPIGGGQATTIAKRQSPHLGGLAATQHTVFWTSGCLNSTENGSVNAFVLGGKISTVESPLATPIGLAVVERDLFYWTGIGPTGGLLVRFRDGMAQVLVSGDFSGAVAADSEAAYLLASTPELGTSAIVRVVPRP